MGSGDFVVMRHCIANEKVSRGMLITELHCSEHVLTSLNIFFLPLLLFLNQILSFVNKQEYTEQQLNMSELRYDGQVVVVTGAGGGLGRA